MTGIPTEEKDAWRATPIQLCACGRCDRKPAGDAAATVLDPKHGLIVACGPRKKQIAKEVARLREREAEVRRS